MAGVVSAIVDYMLTVLAGVASIAEAIVAVDIVHTASAVLTGVAGAVVLVDLTRWTFPARLADALVPEQFVDTEASHTWVGFTKVHLDFTPLAGESSLARALEVVDEIRAVTTQQTRLFQTVINVDIAVPSLPTAGTFAGVSALRQGTADTSIVAGITSFIAWICCDVAVLSLVSSSAQALVVPRSWQIHAHCLAGTRFLRTVRFLLLTLKAREPFRTIALVALWEVDTSSSIITRS